MITYICIFFLPGAAGNFFSRCLSLASDRCVGQIPLNSAHPYLSLDEKFQAFQYRDVYRGGDWIKFESKLEHYSNRFAHHDLVTQSVSVWEMHPDTEFLNQKIEGPDDKKFYFYIDPSEAFEWCILNALHKDSFIEKKWIVEGKKMLDNPDIVKINLVDIFSSYETLIVCIKEICSIVGIELAARQSTMIIELWQQWISTTLMPARFKEFKTRIGYFDT